MTKRILLIALVAFSVCYTTGAQIVRRTDYQKIEQQNKALRQEADSLRRLVDSLRANAKLMDEKEAALEEGNEVPFQKARPMDYTPEITDSLLALWYQNNFNKENEFPAMNLDTVHLSSSVSDEVMMQRLKEMNPFFSLPFNDIVKNYMIVYSEKRGVAMRQAMGLSTYYFPIFEDVFCRYSLPLELKYLAVVESMLKPTATSRAGAKGIWQFMYRTGRSFGLYIDSFVDERMDVAKSTEAAAKYLKSLYEMLGDWPLAVSAYNCGAGNVNKAIRRAGGKRDFWSVYPFLPSETRSYMPAFVGVMYAFTYGKEYGLGAADVGVPSQIDTFEVHRNLHLKQISEVVGVPFEELQYLNPQYYHDIIPGSSRKCIVTVPYSWSAAYLAAEPDSLYSHNAAKYLSDQVIKEINSGASQGSGSRVCHVVRSGDTLSHIARRYRVSVKQLMNWNHLRSDRLSIGQKIYIY